MLLLQGEEKSNGSNIALSDITQEGALLCVGNHLDAKNAQFLNPDGDVIEESGGFHVSRGERVISLSHDNSSVALAGLYCCAIPDTMEKACLDISI